MSRAALAFPLLAGVFASVPALATPLLVGSTPPHATLVCEGRVVGVTPVTLPRREVSGCSLDHRDALPVWFEPATVTGPSIVVELPRLAARAAGDPPADALLLPEAHSFAPMATSRAPRRARRPAPAAVLLMEAP